MRNTMQYCPRTPFSLPNLINQSASASGRHPIPLCTRNLHDGTNATLTARTAWPTSAVVSVFPLTCEQRSRLVSRDPLPHVPTDLASPSRQTPTVADSSFFLVPPEAQQTWPGNPCIPPPPSRTDGTKTQAIAPLMCMARLLRYQTRAPCHLRVGAPFPPRHDSFPVSRANVLLVGKVPLLIDVCA